MQTTANLHAVSALHFWNVVLQERSLWVLLMMPTASYVLPRLADAFVTVLGACVQTLDMRCSDATRKARRHERKAKMQQLWKQKEPYCAIPTSRTQKTR